MRFTRQGQSCSAGTRLFIHHDVYDEVVARSIDAMRALRIGPPMDDETQMGAIISGEQFERVTGYVALARDTPGAKILCGGARPADPALQRGYFYEPTLIEGAPPESPVCQDEIFGPVATVRRWNDYDAMLREANGTQYGLAAAIWTRDLASALDLAKRVQAGFVQVNQFITPRATLSYGGLKMSGLGKENTLEAMLEHFTSSKTVIINPGRVRI
jgi:acyl-CoA reductase-like NAD-dependent aldehyde dehydrogenase